jgi:HPt (histidine-containing phosphotransfer) domain-containing protein
MAKIRQSVDASDAPSLRGSAHALKSSSGNVGATNLAKLCKRLEILGKEENLEPADGILAKLEAEYERVRQALQREQEAAVA